MSHASGKDDGFWRGRRVLITGCTGLVGAWTTRALVARGAHVVGLVRDRVAGSDLRRGGLIRKIDRVHGRLEDFQFLERVVNEHEIQTVFHLAAQAIVGTANRSPLATFEANIRGTYNLLEAARRSGLNPHVVLASSDKAYGDQGGEAYDESSPLAATHPYDVSKACADMLGRSYFESYGLPVCVTRCGNFFGGGDLNWNRLVPGAIRSLLAGEAPGGGRDDPRQGVQFLGQLPHELAGDDRGDLPAAWQPDRAADFGDGDQRDPGAAGGQHAGAGAAGLGPAVDLRRGAGGDAGLVPGPSGGAGERGERGRLGG